MLSSLTLQTPRNVASRATVIATRELRRTRARSRDAVLSSSALVADSRGSTSIYLPLYSASVTFSSHFVSPPKPTLICISACPGTAPCQWTIFGPV